MEWPGGEIFRCRRRSCGFRPGGFLSRPEYTARSKKTISELFRQRWIRGYLDYWEPKQMIGGSWSHDDWKGELQVSGVFRMKAGEIKGKLRPKFVKR